MRLALALVVLASACSSFGTATNLESPDGGTPDGGTDATADAETQVTPERTNKCFKKAFGAPQPLALPTPFPANVGMASFRHASATEVYFSTSDFKLRTYTVDANDNPTGEVANLPIDASSFQSAEHPHVFDDGKGLVFGALPTGGGNPRLFFAERGGSGLWTNVTNVDRIDGAFETQPWVVDNRKIYFTVSQNQRDDIHTIERTDGKWSDTTVPVAALNTSENDEAYPVVTQDEREIFFMRRIVPTGPADVFTAARDDREAPWPVPARLAALSSSDDDRPTWISDDGCVLVLTRLNGNVYTLWRATR